MCGLTKLGQCLRHPFGRQPQTMHTGINLQQDFKTMLQFCLDQNIDLIGSMNDRTQTQPTDFGQLIRAEEPFKKHDRVGIALSAQLHGIFQRQHGKRICRTQCAGNAQQTMSVSIGLDDRHHFCLGRSRACHAQVMRQRGGINLGDKRAAHANNR